MNNCWASRRERPGESADDHAPGPRHSARSRGAEGGEPKAASGASYGSCAQAKAAGAAPLYAGQPGYAKKLDRDGDGVACET
jgi:hypothetical protein